MPTTATSASSTPMAASAQRRKSRVAADSKSVLGFGYLVNDLMADRMPKDMQVQHEGACGRCGHKLTHPDSITRGIGPECAGQVGALSPITFVNFLTGVIDMAVVLGVFSLIFLYLTILGLRQKTLLFWRRLTRLLLYL